MGKVVPINDTSVVNDVEIVQDVEIITKEDAIELTKSIQSTTSALYILIKKAHDSKAWIAMGYESWAEYIKEEFSFSRARSYQLINQANVIDEINEASGVELYITEREARSIKNKLPEITKKLEKNVKDADLSREEAKERAKEIIDESRDIDMAEKYNGNNVNADGYSEEKESNSEMEEWKPEGIDMDKMRRMLSDDDMFYFNSLTTTLEIFKSMPDAVEFGERLKKSSQNTKELLKSAEAAFSWLTQLIDEIE